MLKCSVKITILIAIILVVVLPFTTACSAFKSDALYNTQDYAPFTGTRDAYSSDSINNSSNKLRAMPDIAATPAFYPAISAQIEHCIDKDNYANELSVMSTSQAFDELANGKDIAIVASSPNDEQMRKLTESGQNIRFAKVATDRLVFYTNSNELLNLNRDDIQEIYRGDKDIKAYAISHGNGSTTCIEKFLALSDDFLSSDNVVTSQDMISILSDTSESEEPAVGYAYNQFYRNIVHNVTLQPIPIVTNDIDIFVIYDADSEQAGKVNDFIEWCLNDEGQTIFEECGMGGSQMLK